MTPRVIDKVAWLHLRDGRVLSTRSRGKDVYYLPGGKREAGESDEQCLRREIREELAVTLLPDTLRRIGVFEAQAHGHPAGTVIRMPCYAAEYDGSLAASAEIEEFVWLTYADRERSAPVDRIIFDWLHERGELP
jgi:8-oxo-dGTP diphosphatase